MRINKVSSVGTNLDFMSYSMRKDVTIFEDMRNMVYKILEHFKGGSTL